MRLNSGHHSHSINRSSTSAGRSGGSSRTSSSQRHSSATLNPSIRRNNTQHGSGSNSVRQNVQYNQNPSWNDSAERASAARDPRVKLAGDSAYDNSLTRQGVPNNVNPNSSEKAVANRAADTAEQLKINSILGHRYEDHIESSLCNDPRNTIVAKEVAIAPNHSNGAPLDSRDIASLPRGGTTRADFLVRKSDGRWEAVECKSSSTAGQTSNQTRLVGTNGRNGPITAQGATVVHAGTTVKGSNRLHGGKDLGSVVTETMRPGGIEDNYFHDRITVRQGPRAPRPPEHPIWGRR